MNNVRRSQVRSDQDCGIGTQTDTLPWLVSVSAVMTGNVDLGLLSMSLSGSVWLCPANRYYR